MVGSRIAPQGEPIIRARIGLAWAGAALLAAACGGSPQPAPASPKASASARAQASPSPAFPKTVWVLSPLGLNLRAEPSTAGARVATLPQGSQLDVSDARQVGSDTWLSVRAKDAGADGWVLDKPDLLIHVAVYLHIDNSLGISLLFPQTWQVQRGNPTTFTGPPSDPEGGSLLVQAAGDPGKLMTVPTRPGRELREESPVEVYGKTTFTAIYRLETGSYEFATSVKWSDSRAYLFLYRQSARTEADTALYRQLLAGVLITG